MNNEKNLDEQKISPLVIKHLPRDLPCTLFRQSRPASAQKGLYPTTSAVEKETSFLNRTK